MQTSTTIDTRTCTLPAFPPLVRRTLATLQVNLGYRCNQACQHCHVEAGPQRTESMDDTTLALVLEVLARRRIATLDVTGGAPELHPGFRHLVEGARALGVRVIDRCNLTVLEEPGQDDTAAFLAAQQVRVIASMPCYGEANVERQRGKGVYARSLAGLRRLNVLGYGAAGSGLELDLIYNPVGAHLPPDPTGLEADYKRELGALGIVFNRLLTLTNMPIKRFRHELERTGGLADYLALLAGAHQPDNLDRVMCLDLVSVDWRGRLYDCDFNQMLALPAGGPARHLRELLEREPAGWPIATATHCYGCTAGRGSSCGGALQP